MNERGDISGFDPASDPLDDPMAPPVEPCECYCLHCERTFMSSGMWFQRVVNARDGFPGFWMCPTPNCDGAGFGFDIYPTDPDHPSNEGWCDDDDDDDDEHYEEFDDEDPAAEWDPDETFYKQLDQDLGDEDDDIEGEEWKLGLQPGERPAESEWQQKARRDWEEEQKKYDLPDERPRELDWKDREDRVPRAEGDFNEDDIPF